MPRFMSFPINRRINCAIVSLVIGFMLMIATQLALVDYLSQRFTSVCITVETCVTALAYIMVIAAAAGGIVLLTSCALACHFFAKFCAEEPQWVATTEVHLNKLQYRIKVCQRILLILATGCAVVATVATTAIPA